MESIKEEKIWLHASPQASHLALMETFKRSRRLQSQASFGRTATTRRHSWRLFPWLWNELKFWLLKCQPHKITPQTKAGAASIQQMLPSPWWRAPLSFSPTKDHTQVLSIKAWNRGNDEFQVPYLSLSLNSIHPLFSNSSHFGWKDQNYWQF